MASGALWFALVVIGLLMLRAVPLLGWATGKALTLRAAMLVFITAGFIGPMGWVGDALEWLVTNVNGWGGDLTRAAVGSSVMGIVWFALCVIWVAGFLPTKLIRFDPPDWLAVIGLILPALADSIPGGVGGLFQELFAWIGTNISDVAERGFEG